MITTRSIVTVFVILVFATFTLEARILAPKPIKTVPFEDPERENNPKKNETPASKDTTYKVKNEIVNPKNIVIMDIDSNSITYNKIYQLMQDINADDNILSLKLTTNSVENIAYNLFFLSTSWKKNAIIVTNQLNQEETFLIIQTNNNNLIITPNNGAISLVEKFEGIKDVRILKASNIKTDILNRPYASYLLAGELARNTALFYQLPIFDVNNINLIDLPNSVISEDLIKSNFILEDENTDSLLTFIDFKDFKTLKNNSKLEVELFYLDQSFFKQSIIVKLDSSSITSQDLNNPFIIFENYGKMNLMHIKNIRLKNQSNTNNSIIAVDKEQYLNSELIKQVMLDFKQQSYKNFKIQINMLQE